MKNCFNCDKKFDKNKEGWGCNDPQCPNFTLEGANKETKRMQHGTTNKRDNQTTY
jgi:hypothetical protein